MKTGIKPSNKDMPVERLLSDGEVRSMAAIKKKGRPKIQAAIKIVVS